jgi:hypothetical protein
MNQALVAHTYNLSYSGGRDKKEDQIVLETLSQKRAGGVQALSSNPSTTKKKKRRRTSLHHHGG